MDLVLDLGDRAYSSWSMRIGLLVGRFGLPVQLRVTPLYTADFAALIARLAPARTVPALHLPDGTVIAESLAIAEELAARFPEAGLWPAAPPARAGARMLAAEMHAGFAALRSACPMNLRAAYAESPVSPEVAADLARLEEIWGWARAKWGGAGPWLCGSYSVADAFFAPVAARIATYALPVAPESRAYMAAHLAEPAFLHWRAAALIEGRDQPVYARPYPRAAWPGPSQPEP